MTPRPAVAFADPKAGKPPAFPKTETKAASPRPAAVEKPVSAPQEAPAPVTPPKPEPVKTYTDEEILASVKAPEAKPASKLFIKPKPALAAAPKTKVSRATPPDQTRLWMSLGEAQGILPIDIVNTVAGETGLPGKVVGTVDVREKHLFVDVASEHANSIIAKLNRAEIKGHKVKVKVA